MKIPFYQVDSFAVKPFKGNPAAVIMLEDTREDSWLQAVAQEINLSETAFLRPKGHDYELRWFTPTTEVDLCGHATIASAHILYEFGFYDLDELINFHTRSGVLTSKFTRGTIEINMPRFKVTPIATPALVKEIVGFDPVAIVESDNGVLIAELANVDQVRDFLPNFKAISQLEQNDFAITASGEGTKYDFVSRFFSPKSGIPEDPVTGMAHCILGTYWQEKIGKSQFYAYQASDRGGEIWVKLADNRVFIGGKAVTVLKGEMLKQS
ncbi:MAG: PhzF family phenazine biosynthesis protein [Anaerolineaceae bacterium]|jgi:PhzF family phenazine biosynthesis protein|nr:PhzF family phenazine biosynthesis protein [Anaerolineaceae bacterium]MDD4577909.1 PhzF family phenazine biosynthesis protein [Anaerolineaceae bacterium]